MEPRQSSPESLPNVPAPAEVSPHQHGPEHDGVTPEIGFDGRRNEQTERRLGHQVEAVSQAPAQPPASSLPAPVVTSSDDVTTTASDDTPLVAADEDLIEKEWVDKAKQVIANTKDDPYRREQEVKKLQIDYVKKRYGKVIAAPEDSQAR